MAIKIKNRKKQIGPVGQKIILLLGTGLALGLTGRPDSYFRILQSSAKEWKKINQKSLRKAMRRLYHSKLIDCRDIGGGEAKMVLSENGSKRFLQYNIDRMKIKKPARWDGQWRIAISDIPEYKKRARDAFSIALRRMGMRTLQKSVFINPYPCKDEVDFAAEMYAVVPFVRFILAKEIDIASDLKRKFRLF